MHLRIFIANRAASSEEKQYGFGMKISTTTILTLTTENFSTTLLNATRTYIAHLLPRSRLRLRLCSLCSRKSLIRRCLHQSKIGLTCPLRCDSSLLRQHTRTIRARYEVSKGMKLKHLQSPHPFSIWNLLHSAVS